MLRKWLCLAALVAVLVALWPRAGSLRALTGEEELPGQLIGVLHWLNAAVRPQPDLAPNVALTQAADNPFGMNIFLQLEPSLDVREEGFRLLEAAGFRYARQQFPWEDIEIHARGDFIDRRNDPNGVDAWAKYDNLVALARRHNVELIARLDNPPSWSRAAGDAAGTYAPPDDFDDYGNFVAAVVARYRGQITYFQLWNEPNGNGEWGVQSPNPEAFAELLCLGYARAKAANPHAVIIAPAMTPTFAVTGRDLNDLVFMQRVYDAGGGDCFDIMAAQGYGLRSGPTDQRLQWNRINVIYHLYMRDLLVKNGDAEKPIWIAEAGWNAIPDGLVPTGQEPFGQVTLAQQAQYAGELYARAAAEWPWVGVVNYWFMKRPAPEPEQPSYYFRAMEPDYTPLPAWEALVATADAPLPLPRATPVQRWRPAVFSVGALVLIVCGLQLLAPDRRADA